MKTTDSQWVYYSLKPLATALLNNSSLTVRTYTKGKGLDSNAAFAFKNIDIEVWARLFLEATDKCILRFNGLADGQPTHTDVQRIVDVKHALCHAITLGVDSLLEIPAGDDELMGVRTEFKKALTAGLAPGYDLAVILVSKETGDKILYTPGSSPVNQYGTPVDISVSSLAAPLRVYPSPPALIDQAVVAAFPEAETAEQAVACKYALDFRNQLQIQDDIRLALVSRSGAELSVDTDNPLFASLAEFMVAHESLMEDLQVDDDAEITFSEALQAAVSSFATLAEAIAASWLEYWNNPIIVNTDTSLPVNACELSKNYLADGSGNIRSITVSIPAGSSAPPVLPTLFTKDAYGKYQQLAPQKTSDTTYIYEYTAANKSDATELIAEFPCTDIFGAQPWFEVSVVRNNFDNVKNEFVYKTGPVSCGAPLAPMIDQPETITIDTVDTTLDEALITFFNILLSGTEEKPSVKINLSCSYLANDAVWTSVPVLLIAPTEWSEQLMVSIAEQVTSWIAISEPVVNGHFAMEVTMFNSTGDLVLVLHDVRFSIGNGND